MDRETVVSSLLGSVSKGKERDRDENVVQTLRDRQHLHKILEREAELAVRGEKLAQQRFYDAEADVEVKHWEKKNSDMALHEVNQVFESQRLQLQQANQWADQAQRDKVSLHGDLGMRSGLFRENQATDCQEIEELRRFFCEETDRARQARIDELSMHQERNPTIVSPLLTQTQVLQNKVDSLSVAREFYDPETASSSGATNVPGEPSTIPSPRTCLAAILDCRTIHGTLWVLQETFLKDYLLEKDEHLLSSTLHSSTIPRIWYHLLKN